MKKVAILAVTKKAGELGRRICTKLDADIYTLSKYSIDTDIPMKDGFKSCVKDAFYNYDTLIFIMASGIVVRSIAPLLKGKDVDPGVVVVDEEGDFVTSLISGHLGGANEAAKCIASITGGVPVVTTASDVSGSIAVDTIAMKLRCKLRSLEEAKRVTSLIVAGERVELRVPQNIDSNNPSGMVVVSNKRTIEISQIIPRNIVVGIGCRRDTHLERIERILEEQLIKYNIHDESIRLLATIDIKANETGIIELGKKIKRDLIIIDREKIKEVEDRFITSDFVRKTIGVGAVSAPCAYIASGREGHFIVEKHMEDGVTISLYEEETRNG